MTRQLTKQDLKQIKSLETYISNWGNDFQTTSIPELVAKAHRAWDDADYHEMQGIMAYLIDVLVDNVKASN